MPDLNIKVIPTYGANQYSYTLLQDFLLAKIRAELKVEIWISFIAILLVSFVASDSSSGYG